MFTTRIFKTRGSQAAVIALALATAGRARGDQLVGCGSVGTGTEPISHAFYVSSYPGVNIRQLTMGLAAAAAGRYVLTLSLYRDTFDGAVLGSATSAISLNGDPTTPVPVVFWFGDVVPMPAPKGRAIAFVLRQQGGPDAGLVFASGVAGACGAIETDDATPPLGTARGSVPMTIIGDVGPVSLLANSTFDSGIAGWSVSPTSSATGALSFSSLDADGSITSGSALVTNTGTSDSTGLVRVGGCVQNLLPGTYSVGGKIRSSGSAQAGAVYLEYGFSDASDCSAPGLLLFTGVPSDGVWHEAWGTTLPLGDGAHARSLIVFLVVEKDVAAGTLQANFDDVIVRPVEPATLTVLGAASIHGLAGAFFHTDLWVLNRSYTETISVTAQFRCLPGKDCGVRASTFTLAPRAEQLYADVLSSLLSAFETAGALELSWDSAFGSISAFARTYSPSGPAPTNGTGIPALASRESRGRAIFVGLASNGGNLGAGFRSNVGIYNPASAGAHVSFSLYDGTGILLGTATQSLAGYEAFQINDIFAAVGAGNTVLLDCSLVVSSDVPMFSFVTVIDNQTNDSSFLLPTRDELAP